MIPRNERFPSDEAPAGVEFLKCELELALGFAKLSEIERGMDETEAAGKAKLLAEKAYASFDHFRALVSDIQEQDQWELQRLEVMLRKALARLADAEQKLPDSE